MNEPCALCRAPLLSGKVVQNKTKLRNLNCPQSTYISKVLVRCIKHVFAGVPRPRKGEQVAQLMPSNDIYKLRRVEQANFNSLFNCLCECSLVSVPAEKRCLMEKLLERVDLGIVCCVTINYA